jgi:type IV pilus assembly protein PilY1
MQPEVVMKNLIIEIIHIAFRARKLSAHVKKIAMLVVALTLTIAPVVQASPLSFATSPLFLQVAVRPNILFLLDDSGSMAWEVIPNNGVTSSVTGYCDPESSTSCRDINFNPSSATDRLYLCDGGNLLAFDPTQTYTPWKGVDNAGVAYKNAWLYGGGTDAAPNLTVRDEPYYAAGTTTNLNTAIIVAYVSWTDSNSNNAYDAGECGNLNASSTGVTWSSLTTAQKENFANWYTYYRTRVHVLKRAVTELVNNGGDYYGLATINNNNNAGTQIKDMSVAANKTALLAAVSRIYANNGTPLREALDNAGRYYEGLSQTLGFTPNRTDTITTASPILNAANGGSCQQNFTILMTDGYYNGTTATYHGNNDGDDDTSYDGGAMADSYSDTLADIAMYYYERDLWSSLANFVPITPGVDDAPHQHMVTFGVAFGKNGTLTADPPDRTTAFAWPDPQPLNGAITLEKIDDLRHAAFNGRGKFLNAGSPQSLITGLADYITDIGGRTGASSSVAVNSRSLNTQTHLFQARFTSGSWSGELRALAIDPVTGAVTTQLWNSATQLNAQDWDSGRKIITWFNKSAMGGCAADVSGTTAGGAAFRWSSLSTTQQCLLNDNPATGTLDNDGLGSSRLNFLRGDASGEGTNFRVRGFKQGDLINSAPIYVGSPPYIPDIEAAPHSTFRSTYASRQPMVYVGGNDGMLHGFDANTGNELFAYVPSQVYTNLGALTNSLYTHRYYVDGTPTAADVFGAFTHGTCAAGGCWRTVMAGAMAAGGKGIFALDVTDPAGASDSSLSFTESNASSIALWEFIDSTTPNDMGYVFGQPTIARVRTGANTTAWAAIFGNGYNSSNEKAILYVVNIVNGAIIAKIDLSNGVTGGGNGLSTPAVVDVDGDYVVDYVYAGDLKGNMWKIDLTATNTGNWGSYYTKSGNPMPLFIATDTNGNRQPITERPEVGPHPDGQSGYMVYFGTGKYIESADKTAPSSYPPGVYNNFYGIWDQNSGGGLTGTVTAAVAKSQLISQTISTSSVGTQYRTVTDNRLGSAGSTGNPQSWGNTATACGTAGGSCMGWYAIFPGAGEMSTTNPQLLSATPVRVLFTTLVPDSTPCSYGGVGWLNELNPINGGLFNSDIFGLSTNSTTVTTVIGQNPGLGILPEPTVLHDSPNSRDLKILSGSTGAISTMTNKTGKPQTGRQSWRQLK